ncbi:hypothetical protein SAMN05421767_10646 [Granulicatella balaenopterae]|uniref:Primase C-terminal 2 domain-containing protein n=1 Tax=Granulicatella balaenopterae TaxID=137733 RepID=A0A1H9IP09_9LACT|nr:AAA family ATPase [Granulicatella balaenopterae]SEQ76330.1 hypothetical protein SAMN05421767_10646 [Granulicatella balaenopterae]
MTQEGLNLIEVLNDLDPSILSYQEWVNVGMALKYEGYTALDWDSWSRSDTRYHDGECFKKWDTFNGNGTPVKGGTIVQLAKDYGAFAPVSNGRSSGHELSWNSQINDDYRIVDRDWVEGKEIREPTTWNPIQQLITYLQTLFDATENVGYVTKTYDMTTDDGLVLHKPTKGNWDRTAGKLIEELQKYDDIGLVLGDYNPEAGAWIRFNPLDGKDVKNDNVTAYKYALVESDNMDIAKQNAILRELELPIATLTHSGGKSLHAIVKIDAADYTEYKQRVEYVYNICKKNGFTIDTQNRNPSRLSRMPGVMRNGKKQFLIDTNIGKHDYNEWFEWIEDLNDDLPEPEKLSDTWDDMPDLAPELIKGVLRQGHKMLIAGASKAGKSFALIEMSIAIAEGMQWLGFECVQGRVLYVNLELDRPSCLHRFKDVYNGLGIDKPKNLDNIDIWNLRSKALPMDKLAPKLIRRAQKRNYSAVIIDPIYKVLTGDENSAEQMAHFTNQFDKVATELGASVIYCHHHSKGSQGGKKSMDRASGSGVFARDPDAIIDLVELDLTDDLLDEQKKQAHISIIESCIKATNNDYFYQKVTLEDKNSIAAMENHAEIAIPLHQRIEMNKQRKEASKAVDNQSAWRIDGTLREFAKMDEVNVWFKYPVHIVDNTGVLADIELDDGLPYKKPKKSPQNGGEKEGGKKSNTEKIDNAMAMLDDGVQPILLEDLKAFFTDKKGKGPSEKTIRRWIKEGSHYHVDNCQIKKNGD